MGKFIASPEAHNGEENSWSGTIVSQGGEAEFEVVGELRAIPPLGVGSPQHFWDSLRLDFSEFASLCAGRVLDDFFRGSARIG